MKRNGFAWMVLGLLAWMPVSAFELVTQAEMRASEAAAPMVWPKSHAGPEAPQIVLVQPSLADVVSSPTTIEMRFQAAQGSQVRPESFRVLYGRLRLDITARVVQNARISPQGLRASQASLPKGQHRLWLSIEDTQGRTGQAQLDFQIQ